MFATRRSFIRALGLSGAGAAALTPTDVLASAAAMAALPDTAHVTSAGVRNREVRQFTIEAIRKLGYEVGESHTNFVPVDIRRDAQPVIDACAKQDLLIGRRFPPPTRTARISIGTLDEMTRGLDVLDGVLRAGTGH